jgi:uncharacterized protein YdaL
MWLRGVSAALLLLIGANENARGASKPPLSETVLILYDSSGPYGWIGEVHGRLLSNLLGHFPFFYEIVPVESYRAGDLGHYRACFYIGSVFNNPLPGAFLQDALDSTKPFCWFKYNLWQLDDASGLGPQFESKFGFRFEYMDTPASSTITYKGESFSKNPLDSELGLTTILNAGSASAPALAVEDATFTTTPYAVRASNFWYIADVPFSYMSEEDRYLVFADLLHDILEVQHPQSRRALLRLEDISPTYPTELLRQAADYLAAEGVPFGVSVIPFYTDPLGYYNGGIPESAGMSSVPEFVAALQYMVAKGGQLVMHGYTHQYSNVPNPFSAVSGDDYEFFRVTYDAETNLVDYMPVPEDSQNWAQNRVNAGLQEFQQAGLSAVAWETPHYAASPADYAVFAGSFDLTFQRVLYFDSTQTHPAGQFFPYPIQADFYGQKILPENLGNIDPASWYTYPPRLPADLIRAAGKNRAIRDGWAGAFFHPYLDLSYLQELVSGIKALGFTYVPLTDSPPLITNQPRSQTNSPGATVVLRANAVGSPPLTLQWRFNGTPLAGATNSWLALTNIQFSQAGNYSLLASNTLSTATSSNAIVRVLVAPAISHAERRSTTVSFSFASRQGQIYVGEYKDRLEELTWNAFTTLIGNGGTLAVTNSVAGSSRFYRLRVE